MNQTYRTDIQHYGIRGMKWGVRRAQSKTVALDVKVKKQIKRYDRGKDISKEELSRLSKNVRKHKYRIDQKVSRGRRFIIKSEKADAKGIINRYNRDPLKKAAVKDYIDALQLNQKTLDELRLQLIDVRI